MEIGCDAGGTVPNAGALQPMIHRQIMINPKLLIIRILTACGSHDDDQKGYKANDDTIGGEVVK